MMQLPSDKYTIAWFKLAEFVGRGEKERALGMYRLLAHSLPDEAFAAQLEGDLLLAFQDERALDSYKRSALKYERTGRLPQAVAVQEHLASLLPQSLEVLVKIIHLYQTLHNEVKIDFWMKSVMKIGVVQDKGSFIHTFIDSLNLSSHYQLRFHEYLITAWVVHGYQDQTALREVLEHLLDASMQLEDSSAEIAQIISRLNAQDESLATYAADYLKRKF
jgi:tetratricopeptide (TPR) repeat protein